MYDFSNIEDFPVWEYYFKDGLARFGMLITDGNDNPLKRMNIMIPGFHMDENGQILKVSHLRDHGLKDVCFLPPKDKVEQMVKKMISSCSNVAIKGRDMVVICASEESKQIGMVMVAKGNWKPLFSVF